MARTNRKYLFGRPGFKKKKKVTLWIFLQTPTQAQSLNNAEQRQYGRRDTQRIRQSGFHYDVYVMKDRMSNHRAQVTRRSWNCGLSGESSLVWTILRGMAAFGEETTEPSDSSASWLSLWGVGKRVTQAQILVDCLHSSKDMVPGEKRSQEKVMNNGESQKRVPLCQQRGPYPEPSGSLWAAPNQTVGEREVLVAERRRIRKIA